MQLTAIDSAPLIRLNYKKFKEHLLLPSRVRRKIGNRGGAHPELISVHRDLGFWVFLGPGNSERHSWNLRCVRNGAELRVEVKGTTSTGDSVELTAAEVNYATRGAPPVHLAVVSNIKIDNTKTLLWRAAATSTSTRTSPPPSTNWKPPASDAPSIIPAENTYNPPPTRCSSAPSPSKPP